jgi:RNA polymerase sigma-70 factor (ECF subfamily)
MSVQTAEPEVDIEWAETVDRIRRYVAGRVGDRDLAEDITQDVIVRSIAAGALEHVDNPIGWLIRSASNAVIDHFRTQRRSEPLDSDAHLADDVDIDVDEDETLRDLAQCVRPLISQLEPAYRDALLWVDIEGRTQLEAAGLANVSLSGMKSRVQRGRRQLKQRLTVCCEIELDARRQPTGARLRSPGSCGSCGCAAHDPSRHEPT